MTIDYAQRSGSSKIRPIRDTLGFLALIIRTVVYFNPLKVFLPLTAVLSVALTGSLVYDFFFDARGPNGELAPNLGDKTVLLFVATVQTLTLGLVADLIDKKSRLRSAHDSLSRSVDR